MRKPSHRKNRFRMIRWGAPLPATSCIATCFDHYLIVLSYFRLLVFPNKKNGVQSTKFASVHQRYLM